jgi:hypothetical protein
VVETQEDRKLSDIQKFDEKNFMKKIKVLFIMFTVMLDQLEPDMLKVVHKDGHQAVVALLILMLVHMMKHKTWHTKDTFKMNKLFAILQQNQKEIISIHQSKLKLLSKINLLSSTL